MFRNRFRDYDYRGRSLDSPGLSSLMSEVMSDDTSLPISSTTASSSSTRDRILQGRWRTDVTESSHSQHRPRYRTRFTPRSGGWGYRSASPSIRTERDRFSDTSSVSTFRNSRQYQESEPETLRSYDTHSISSTSSLWSASNHRDPLPPQTLFIRGFRDQEDPPLSRTRSFQSRGFTDQEDPPLSRTRSFQSRGFTDQEEPPLSRTRSFQSIRPLSPEFNTDTRPRFDRETRNLDDYKSLSAQDFRKSILREERLALGTDDEKLLSSHRDMEIVDNDGYDNITNTLDNDNGDFYMHNKQHSPIFNGEKSGYGRISPSVSLSESTTGSSLNVGHQLPAPPQNMDNLAAQNTQEITSMRHFSINGATSHEQLSQEVDDELMKLLRNSQAQNTRLKLELKALESLLESAKFQLASTKDQVAEDNIDYEKDKKEDEAVAKKLTEIEEELKILSFSESLTDQALGQLKVDNEKLRDERSSLLQVLYKLSRVI